MQANSTTETKRLPAPEMVRELADLEGTCVTVYLAGHKGGSGSRPMRVRLHALLAEAERLLESRGVLPTDRQTLLDPLRAQCEEPELNSGHADSIAYFRNARKLEQLNLPWEVEDMLSVEGVPMLTPLVHGMRSNRNFFLLAVSKKNTRLFECGSSTQRMVEMPPGAPKALEEFAGFDAPQQTLGQTGGGATYSMDTYAEKERKHLHDFCRALDRSLQPLLEQRGLPLVLAGATVELACYREVNRYAQLAPHAVEGSPDAGATDAELAARGRVALKSFRPADELHAVDLFLRAGTGKKSSEIEEILRASAAGRVMHLFLSGEGVQTGDVDRILDRVLPSGAPRGKQDNLANAAAVETLRHGGAVWWLDEPLEQSSAAAVFRW